MHERTRIEPAAIAWTAVVLLLSSCAGSPDPSNSSDPVVPAATPSAPELSFTDLSPEFFAWYDEHKEAPVDEMVEAFEAFAAAHPRVYNPNVIGEWWEDPQARSEHLEGYFTALPGFEARMRERADELPGSLTEAYEVFVGRFPDTKWRGPAWIVPSLRSFDGGTRRVDGQIELFFGVDAIADFHGDRSLDILYFHELFHIFHGQYFEEGQPDEDPLWRAVWAEGMALHVSADFTAAEEPLGDILFMRDLASAEEALPRALVQLKEHQHSTDRDIYWRFFGGKADDLPPRMGYLVGYRVVELAQKDRSLDELARMERGEVETLVTQALDSLTTGADSNQ